ncbi:MAG: hypothetical protein RLZZ15_3116 [Verrucomicrobiota bacterium]|jgi:putative ABC transport system permease protein
MLAAFSSAFRAALRPLAKSPAFSVVAIAILAVGLGASTAIFSVVHALLLRPLAYRDSAALVQVQSHHPEQGVSVLAPATFADLARDARSFTALAAQTYDYVNLTKTTAPARLTGVQATADYFRVFGVAPLLGRTWLPAETLAGAAPVVVVSEELWRTSLHTRADLAGATLTLDDVAHTVIGVMPLSFSDPWGNAKLWRPIAMNAPATADRVTRYWSAFARLRDDATLPAANTELATLGARYAAAFPEHNKNWSLVVADLQGLVVGNYRSGLLVVLGAVGCVLLITCANVAGLSLVRALGRRKELAVRAALGASRAQLLRQLLAESLVLALLGGALGVLLAHWGVSAIVAVVGDGYLPRVGEIAINQPVLLAALALTLVTGVAFGLAPALAASRTDAADALKDGGRGSTGPAARRFRSALVVAELALALVLLVSAGLLARSFAAILQRPAGMKTDNVLAVGLSLSTTRYDTPEKRRAFYLAAETAAGAVPGVTAAGFTQTLPFTWGIPITLVPVGASRVTERTVPQVYYDSVGVDFFRATGIPLVVGRAFTARDDPAAPPVVVISAATARKFFGDENPVGRLLRPAGPPSPASFEIIGVVGDVLRTGLTADEVPLQIYRALAQRPTAFATLMVQTATRPDAVAKSIRQAIWSVDPDQAIGTVSPVAALVSSTVTQPRLYVLLFGLFAALALALSAVGLYGLIAFGVAQRTREFGIRTALGAAPRALLALVLREGALLIALGLALGIAGAFAATRLLGAVVTASPVQDPLVFALVPLLLATVAALACAIPARRAARVNPVEALRSE